MPILLVPLDALSTSLRRADERAEASFAALVQADAYAQATGVITATVDAVTRVEDETRDLVPPAALADLMVRLYAAIDTMQDLFAISTEIEDFSLLRGGPEVYVTR